MRLATLRSPDGGTHAARVHSDLTTATVLPDYPTVRHLLEEEHWEEIARTATGPQRIVRPADLAPVIPRPGKIICVGLNYARHIEEMGHERPDVPTLFIKFPEALTGPYDDVLLPPWAQEAADFEGELAVVVGKRARRVTARAATEHIAGYAVMNDYSLRDYQYRTLQWHQGKSLEKSSGFGPWLTTREDFRPGAPLRTWLNDAPMQEARTDDLVFSPEALIEYLSHLYPLEPGDVIVTGTPAGVGHARSPKRYLRDGDTVRVRVEGLGEIANTTIFERT
ncbi:MULTISPECIES: fumarylacetoacetate hydrolase family protein [unclassified Corynebacterium]|uniref:fumarylacetoacetate hydrolase family protein n=1 Tax=unclassified Corynebacterium TaxID=2624378 RepID=UPI0029CA1B46|nr:MULTISPECIES: fumarylacetoacetate hydrolase family protein [unclassified Corynebacterium]WPF66841.1 fumarylacetoacetate hydrolase family protein [Corynebacterium sp. 22KM0430]WPF69329.1 fumarylacetoacetate hydrolase family protein [Corynebacterium sp. 21KM1197]